MSRIAYVNGRYVSHARAAVHVEDRGFQFADGVYEVIAVRNGRLVDEGPHLERLARSLAEMAVSAPMTEAALGFVMGEVIRRNRVADGSLYLQITRGVAKRDHVFPRAAVPGVVITARPARRRSVAEMSQGVAVISVPDIRWGRCDIKSVSLLPNVLAKQQAAAAGAYEAWQVDTDGLVTEGSASNAWIVTAAGELVTRHLDDAILAGVTRRTVAALAADMQIKVVERAFSVDEAKAASEAFLTSTTSFVKPVTSIDGAVVSTGEAGPLTRRLIEAYDAHMDKITAA